MFTARATTSTPTTREIASSVIVMSFAHGLIAETSVGLNATAVEVPVPKPERDDIAHPDDAAAGKQDARVVGEGFPTEDADPSLSEEPR